MLPPMDLNASEALLTQLERSPEAIQLHNCELERLIMWTVDDPFRLAQAGIDDDYKTRVLATEHRAEVFLDKLNNRSVN